MAIEYTGNAIPAPGFRVGNTTLDREILYSTNRFTQKGVTLTPGQGVVTAGTVLGQVTRTKRYSRYASGAGNGAQNPEGILRQTVDTGTDTAGAAFQANIVISGIIKYEYISGADANAITALNARIDAASKRFVF